MDPASFNWEKAQHLYAQHHVLLEVLFTSSATLRFLVPAWGKIKTSKHAKYKKQPWIPLAMHVISGTILLFRYYHLYLVSGTPPSPTVVDLLLGYTFFVTSMQLAVNIREGIVPVIRTSLQATAFQQLLAWTLGYAYGDAKWHRAATKLLDNFTWVRWLMEYGGAFQGFRTFGARFTGAIVIAQPIALWQGDYPAGIPMYGAMMATLLMLDKWASRKLDGKPGFVPRALAHCGFVTAKEEAREMLQPADHEQEQEQNQELKQE